MVFDQFVERVEFNHPEEEFARGIAQHFEMLDAVTASVRFVQNVHRERKRNKNTYYNRQLTSSSPLLVFKLHELRHTKSVRNSRSKPEKKKTLRRFKNYRLTSLIRT